MTRARDLADAGIKADYLDNVASDINTLLASKLSLTGGTMTGDLETATNKKVTQKGAFMQSSTHQALVLGG